MMRNECKNKVIALFSAASLAVTAIAGTALTANAYEADDVTAAVESSSLYEANGLYTVSPGKEIVLSELPKDDKMVGFSWSDFKIPTSEKITKVEFNLSTTASKIGKWQGAIGTSTSVAPDYWAQGDDMTETFSGKTGTITWDVEKATQSIIQTQYGGELKIGFWWVDCGTVTVDSINVYTSAYTGSTGATTTTAPGGSSTPSTGSGGHVTKLNQAVVYSELPKADKMFGWEWADLGVASTEKIQKVEINISTTKSKIGKWQGAFGSSTTVAPDYWTQTDDMQETFSGNTGTITWDVDKATQAIIQTQYEGSLKLGVWWIDCDSFTVDSVVVYTDKTGTGSAATTTTPKATTTTTTAKPAATTTKATTTTMTIKTTTTAPKATTTNNAYATTTAKPADPTPSTGGGDTITGVSFGKEIDLSKYKDITSVDFVFSSTPSNGSGAVVFGQWALSKDYNMSDLKNNTLSVSVDQDYPTVTINKYYSDTETSLVSVIVHTKGGSAAVTTTTPKATTTTPKATTTTTTTPKATTTTPKATTTAKPGAVKAGDVNLDGIVNLKDLIALNKASAGILTINADQTKNADLDGNNKVDAADVAMLVKMLMDA